MRNRNYGYFVRRSRFTGASNALNSITFFIKNIIFSVIIFIIFIFSLNLIIKYLINRIDIEFPEISFISFNSPRFLIIENKNFYAVYSNGSIKFIESNIDNYILPVISGISTKENDMKKQKVLKDILKLKKELCEKISEINIKNPENIIILTVEGKKIFTGNSINNEKLENYNLVKNRLKDMKIKYGSVLLTYDDRVIIKKEGK